MVEVCLLPGARFVMVSLAALVLVACSEPIRSTPDPEHPDRAVGTANPEVDVAADALLVINATNHGLAAASLLEAEPDELPFVVAGHGLVLAIRAPAVAVNVDGSLLIGRRSAGHLVVRAILRPGSAPASELPSATSSSVLATGPSGPTIVLEPQVESLDAVFSSVALTPPAASPAWRAMAGGGWSLPIPAGMSLANVEGDEPSPFFLRPGTSTVDSLELNGPHPRRPRPEDFLFRGARLDGSGSVDHRGGRVTWYGVSYDHDGLAWRQRFYVLPEEGKDTCMTLKVQARASTSAEVFALADQVATDFEGPRPE